MLHRLNEQWGVGRIYGYPGDGINGFMGAFQELEGKPEFIQVRHEVIAGYAACAHAKFTDEVGVCIATSGPGAIQLLNGLYDAKLDHQPVVAIVGQQQRVSLGSDWLQEVDLHALLKDVGEYVQTCMAPAQQEVIEVAEMLGAGVAKALNGRAALPDDLPFVTGSIGLLGTKPSSDMMGDCDTLLMIGSNFPFADWLPQPGPARGVQIDIDGRLIGMRYPMGGALVGDSRDTLRALLPLLERKRDRSWREKIERGVERWWRA